MAKSKKPKSAKTKKPKAAKAKKPAGKVSKAARAKKPAAKTKKPAKSVAPKAKSKKPAVKKSSKPPKRAKTAVKTSAPVSFALDDPPVDPGLQPLANPSIASPTNNSGQTSNQNLAVTASTNNTGVRYRYELTDVTGMPPYPTPYTWDVTPVPPATAINTTVPAAQLQSNKTYTLKVYVHPSDTGGLTHGTASVTFTTGP